MLTSNCRCIWRIQTAGFAEQNGRNAKLNGRYCELKTLTSQNE